MAHKVFVPEEKQKTKKQFRFLPEGRFGLSLYVGSKEIFLGIAVSNVIQETVTRSRKIKTTPGTVQVFKWD